MASSALVDIEPLLEYKAMVDRLDIVERCELDEARPVLRVDRELPFDDRVEPRRWREPVALDPSDNLR